jgi:hypothetical protein
VHGCLHGESSAVIGLLFVGDGLFGSIDQLLSTVVQVAQQREGCD